MLYHDLLCIWRLDCHFYSYRILLSQISADTIQEITWLWGISTTVTRLTSVVVAVHKMPAPLVIPSRNMPRKVASQMVHQFFVYPPCGHSPSVIQYGRLAKPAYSTLHSVSRSFNISLSFRLSTVRYRSLPSTTSLNVYHYTKSPPLPFRRTDHGS